MGQREGGGQRRGQVLGAPASLLHLSLHFDQILEACHRWRVGELGERRIQFKKLSQAIFWRHPVGNPPHKYALLVCGNEGDPEFPEQSRSKVLSTEQAVVMGFQVALV